MRLSRSSFIVVVLLLIGALPALAQTPVPLEFHNKKATGRIDLFPLPLTADLTIKFEDVEGLGPLGLTASARAVDPLDPVLLARLPPGVTIPIGFPVLLEIDAPPTGGLTFRGVVTVSLYTHVLNYSIDSGLVLYSAHAGGSFRDITRTTETGSYRVSGGGGTFSEFMIVVDLRPIDTIIVEKYDALKATLDAHADKIPPDVTADLNARLAESRAFFLAGQLDEAIEALDGFVHVVRQGSGTTIPDVFRADGTVVNVAGLLRAAAATLKFSLEWKAGHP